MYQCTELGREPYHLEVLEATKRELAILGKRSRARKGKATDASMNATYQQDIVGLRRRLDVYENFMKQWEPKLKKWDSFIEELHEAELASEGEGTEGKAQTMGN
jgi:hypothetical protein